MNTSSTENVSDCGVLKHDFQYAYAGWIVIQGIPSYQHRFVCTKCGLEVKMPYLYRSDYVSFMHYLNSTITEQL